MPKMSMTDKAVMATLAVSGVGVVMSAAVVRLREARDWEATDEKEESTVSTATCDQLWVKVRHLLGGKSELLDAWADHYVGSRNILEKSFRIFGQMFVAPVALVVLDALYERYFDGQMPCFKAFAFR